MNIAKKSLLLLIKIGIPIALIVYLVFEAKKNQAFADLRDNEKNWTVLAVAAASCTTAVLITIIRWYYLVRALDVPCRFREVLRIGLMGYLFNLAPMGIVGGDVLKAVLLGKRYKNARAKSFASMIVDRLLGLYILFVVATAAILLTGFLHFDHPQIRFICRLTIWLTVAGTIGTAALFILGAANGRISPFIKRQPVYGESLERLVSATAMYHKKPLTLLNASLMSVAVHSFFTLGVFLLAMGLFGDLLPSPLSLKAHFVVAPLSAATGVVPLCLGPFEAVLSYLYQWVGGTPNALAQGLVIALGYRIVTVLIALVGLVYYFGSKTEVARAMNDQTETQSKNADEESSDEKSSSDKNRTLLAA